MSLPLTLRHRVLAGCRVQVPFGSRMLTGRSHAHACRTRRAGGPPGVSLRDEEPVLDRELLDLASWIAEYYCAPIGEVLKGMLPLSGETAAQHALYVDGLGPPGRAAIDLAAR